jgi:IS605 OrfB family transposase
LRKCTPERKERGVVLGYVLTGKTTCVIVPLVGFEARLLNIKSTHVAVHAKLEFLSNEDKREVLDLMRRFSSAYRWIYNRLVEGGNPSEIIRVSGPVSRFGLNSYYYLSARELALYRISSLEAKGVNPRKIIFGSRALFNRLCGKGSLKSRAEAKRVWRERRKGILLNFGNKKSVSGNYALTLLLIDGELWLRINTGTSENPEYGKKGSRYIYAKVKTSHPYLSHILGVVGKSGIAPISVYLKLIDGKVYAIFTKKIDLPEPVLTKYYGVLGVDINARPLHLALAVVEPDGNLRKYTTISLEEVIRIRERYEGKEKYSNYLDNFYWQVAHQVVDLAKNEGVAIAIEDIFNLPKGFRGDGNKKLRRILGRFAYRSILERIVRVASREGVEVWGVNPAYTSVIGMLKYAPMHSLSKDVAAAYVIGRRALGFSEKVPKRYLQLMASPEYREAVINWFNKELRALEEKIGGERNEYKLNRLKREKESLEKAFNHLNRFLSLEGSTEGLQKQGVTYGRNPEEPNKGDSLHLWKALQVGVLRPLLGQKVPRDLSVLKPLLVGGVWNGGGGLHLGPSWLARAGTHGGHGGTHGDRMGDLKLGETT